VLSGTFLTLCLIAGLIAIVARVGAWIAKLLCLVFLVLYLVSLF
jgi:uncharacterized membrane protein YtjA (UPF0391 family)